MGCLGALSLRSDDVKKRLDFVDENLRAMEDVQYDPSLQSSTTIPEQTALPGEFLHR